VIGGSALLTATFYALAYFICLDKEHRALPVNWLRARLRLKAATA
jgi:hypothetical protein